MNYPDDYVSTLVDLGLSSTQAKVFLALLKFKILNARTINRLSGVTRPDVYRVLGELEAAGFVEKIIAKPEKFKAIPAKECISTLMQRRINKTQQLQKQADELTSALKENSVQVESDEKLGFVLITGRTAVYARVGKMLQEVQQTICFLGVPPRRLSALFTNCQVDLENALRRNVKCKVILKKSERMIQEPFSSLGKNSNFSLRFFPEQPKTAFSIWDNKQVLMGTSQLDTTSPTPILWSNNTSIVSLGQEYFWKTWATAERLNVKRLQPIDREKLNHV